MDNSFFQFNNFLIKNSLFELSDNNETIGDLSVGFKSSAKLDFEKGRFELELGIFVSDENEMLKIEIDSVGYFSFENLTKDDLPNFLYINAPAILFPYLRAYISSLTTLSGIRPIVLPTLNLTALKEDLQSNTEEVSL